MSKSKTKKAVKKSAPKKSGNWLAVVDSDFTRGAKNEDVKDKHSFVVTANDHKSAEKEAGAAHKALVGAQDNQKLRFSTRPLTEKENAMWNESKHVPVF